MCNDRRGARNMEGSIFWVMGVILCAVILNAEAEDYYSKTIPAVYAQEKMTNLHFFLHDIVSGENATVAKIAQPNSTAPMVTLGALFAVNDAMRVGMESTSKLIGRAKGLYVTASQDDDFNLVLYMDYGFVEGKFNGSSFVVCSRNPVMETERELAVVGGRGDFKMARGFAKLHTRYMNFTTGDAIIEYNVTLFHY